MAVVTTNLGVVTAYGEAVNGGYTGTKVEFQEAMNNYAQGITNASEALSTANANTTKIGTLSNLTTTDKTNLVAAVNEIDSDVTQLNADITAKLPSVTASGTMVNIVDGADGVACDVTTTGTTIKRCGKNFLAFSSARPAGYTVTTNGITYTVNDDYSVTVSGTAESNADLVIATESSLTPMRAGTYKIVGGQSANFYIRSNFGGSIYSDYGSGCEFTFADGNAIGNTYIRVLEGQTVNATIYPMILLSTETDTTYEAYDGITTTDTSAVTTLKGENHIWADSGTVTVTYRADIQLYIERRLAEVVG